jgi:hypothetical protein
MLHQAAGSLEAAGLEGEAWLQVLDSEIRSAHAVPLDEASLEMPPAALEAPPVTTPPSAPSGTIMLEAAESSGPACSNSAAAAHFMATSGHAECSELGFIRQEGSGTFLVASPTHSRAGSSGQVHLRALEESRGYATAAQSITDALGSEQTVLHNVSSGDAAHSTMQLCPLVTICSEMPDSAGCGEFGLPDMDAGAIENTVATGDTGALVTMDPDYAVSKGVEAVLEVSKMGGTLGGADVTLGAGGVALEQLTQEPQVTLDESPDSASAATGELDYRLSCLKAGRDQRTCMPSDGSDAGDAATGSVVGVAATTQPSPPLPAVALQRVSDESAVDTNGMVIVQLLPLQQEGWAEEGREDLGGFAVRAGRGSAEGGTSQQATRQHHLAQQPELQHGQEQFRVRELYKHNAWKGMEGTVHDGKVVEGSRPLQRSTQKGMRLQPAREDGVSLSHESIWPSVSQILP